MGINRTSRFCHPRSWPESDSHDWCYFDGVCEADYNLGMWDRPGRRETPGRRTHRLDRSRNREATELLSSRHRRAGLRIACRQALTPIV